jgi:hypothetical protein
MYMGCSGETCVYACFLTNRACICGKMCFFGSGRYKKRTSSLHREIERPFKKVAWGEEKFVVTKGNTLQ